MAVGIKGAPNDYDFGLHFNYATWIVGTELMLANVPWTNDYRDIVSFDSSTGLDDYLNNNSENYTISNANTQKFQNNVKINIPINDAMKFNYLRARNPHQPGQTADRTYYYFILDVIYRAFNTTELVVQLDVWATFGREVSFGSCYVERGHIGIANSNNFRNYGRDYLTEAEGMDIGGEYRTIHVENTAVIPYGQAWVLICSTINLLNDPGTVTSPNLQTSYGGEFQGIPSGANFYYFKSPDDFVLFMRAYAETPWVTQGIISITAVPPLTRYYAESDLPDPITVNGVTFYPAPGKPPTVKSTTLKSNWRTDTYFTPDVLGSRYANLMKFFTYPYMVIELTTFTGSPVIMKPEMWQDADATIREMGALVPPGQRIAFMPYKYNSSGETSSGTESDADMVTDDFGEFLDMAATLDNFPSFPLVNNMAISFLASNKNGLAFQFANAAWDQQRALAGAQAGVDISNAGIRNTSVQSGIQNTLATQQLLNSQAAMPGQMITSGIGQIAGGTISGSMMGPAGMAIGAGAGAVGAVVGDINQGIQMGVQQQNLTAQTAATSNAAISNVRTQGSVRDTNADYARFAARGDYAMQRAGINAKIQDAKMNQPSVSGQFGGDAFNLINNTFGYSLRWKFINPQAMRQIGDYWLRYGYAVQQFVPVPTNFKVMTKFTYWKLLETYISQGKFPETFKQTIRGIFEKGVTVWSDPDDIGNVDWADNQPMSGVSF